MDVLGRCAVVPTTRGIPTPRGACSGRGATRPARTVPEAGPGTSLRPPPGPGPARPTAAARRDGEELVPPRYLSRTPAPVTVTFARGSGQVAQPARVTRELPTPCPSAGRGPFKEWSSASRRRADAGRARGGGRDGRGRREGRAPPCPVPRGAVWRRAAVGPRARPVGVGHGPLPPGRWGEGRRGEGRRPVPPHRGGGRPPRRGPRRFPRPTPPRRTEGRREAGRPPACLSACLPEVVAAPEPPAVRWALPRGRVNPRGAGAGAAPRGTAAAFGEAPRTARSLARPGSGFPPRRCCTKLHRSIPPPRPPRGWAVTPALGFLLSAATCGGWRARARPAVPAAASLPHGLRQHLPSGTARRPSGSKRPPVPRPFVSVPEEAGGRGRRGERPGVRRRGAVRGHPRSRREQWGGGAAEGALPLLRSALQRGWEIFWRNFVSSFSWGKKGSSSSVHVWCKERGTLWCRSVTAQWDTAKGWQNQQGTCLLMHATSLAQSPIAVFKRLSTHLPWLKWVSSGIAACHDFLSELQKTMISLRRGGNNEVLWLVGKKKIWICRADYLMTPLDPCY